MSKNNWVKEIKVAITVSDENGKILEMNDKSCKTFEKDGGNKLIGTNILDCHPEPARTKVQDLLKNPRVNCYTIEKNGVKKLIYQAPWFENDKFKGYVEMSMEIPFEMPHFIRGN
ncbi:MAG: diguanylate cyclase [Proteobacteria bacterium]|nr:diguanylate cyclase [Pseudomonadota bacterium]